MPIRAFFLVLFAATAHATWNLFAKRFSHLKHLIWIASAMEALILAPAVVWLLMRYGTPHSETAIVALVASGVLHVLYTECLLQGYRAGDFTLVYPLARGSAPLLSFAGAIAFLHEHASRVAILGALLISVGILLASGVSNVRHKRARSGIFWGAATGITIACYTIVDAYSVTTLLMAPLIVEYAENLFRVIFFSRRAWQQRRVLRAELSECWPGALTIAVLMPMSYVMALAAMRLAPVSHVAPVREMSMMIGMYLGARYLNEGNLVRRAVGSVLIACGVAALAM